MLDPKTRKEIEAQLDQQERQINERMAEIREAYESGKMLWMHFAGELCKLKHKMVDQEFARLALDTEEQITKDLLSVKRRNGEKTAGTTRKK